MNAPERHFRSIADYLEALGYSSQPEHPMLAVCTREEIYKNTTEEGGAGSLSISTDFYVIAIKKIIAGEIFYGRTRYDFSNGSMMFAAPRQAFFCNETVVTKDSIMIVIHEDFIKGHLLYDTLKNTAFFPML